MEINERLSWYELTPVKQDETGKTIKPTTGLIFLPGARVDSRAYAHVLRPLAEAGYLIAVLKEPFGFSVIQPDHAGTVVELHPEIAHWAVGGHSLGGVTAASFADSNPQINGLVLYGSYPANRVGRIDLKVISIAGSRDGLTTPADIEASKANLPPSAATVVIDGASHSTFGDYGVQPGDGLGVGDRAAQQTEIRKATQAFLASLTPSPPPKKKR